MGDMWQINIVTDTNKTVPITIIKNAPVADLFKKFREKERIYQKQKLTLGVLDGVELNEGDKRRLVDLDSLRDRCTIQLIVHLDGGGLPTENEIEQQVRDPTKAVSLEGKLTRDLPDIMGMDDESPRVKMSCGHAIASTSLALYCRNEIANGAHKIQCPASDCAADWSFGSIVDAACLSENETFEFERTMITNGLSRSTEIKNCPGCGDVCRRSKQDYLRVRCIKCTSKKGRNFDFCWSCLQEWKNGSRAWFCGNPLCGDLTRLYHYLAICDTKTINGVECPSRRACPSCLMLIEYTKKCKHMKCPNKRCGYDFCFICLHRFPCKTGPHDPCELAPRQQLESAGPPATDRNCAIL